MEADAGDWRPVDPCRTSAVVIGIEAYAGGAGWDLGGPAADAVRMVEWLRASGVPDDRIDVLLSPLADLAPLSYGPADRAAVQDVFLRRLPACTGEMLIVYWAGHGVVDADRRRRLFFADATERDKRTVDLDALLATMSSEYLPSFGRQIWFVDACQTFADPAGAYTMSSDGLPGELPRRDLDQDVLFAAGPGQPAANLTGGRTGLFTRELLEQLGAADPAVWPPDPDLVMRALRNRFAERRAAGRAGQTPTYFWHRSRSGSTGQVMNIPGDQESRPGPAGRLPVEQVAAVVDALMEIDEFVSPGGREEILMMMRREITTAVPWHNAGRLHAFAIVRTCCRFPGGLDELVEVVRSVTTNTSVFPRLELAAHVLAR